MMEHTQVMISTFYANHPKCKVLVRISVSTPHYEKEGFG